MRYHRRSLILAIILTIQLLEAQFAAQNPRQTPSPKAPPQQKSDQQKSPDRNQNVSTSVEPIEISDEVVKIDTGLVQLDVTVIDQNNIPAFNLNKDDFTIYENRVKQAIESVKREEVPISYGMIIDASGSMRGKLQSVTEATSFLLKQMRSDDEGFVAQFKYDTELVQAFTSDKRKLESSLEKLFPSGGTALLDAIIASADYAAKKSKNRRKALIIISDGLEKDSWIREKEVMEAITESEAQVYLVGFFDEDQSSGLPGKPENKKAKELLKRLADESGGRAFFPNDVGEMAAIAAQIAKDLRTQYTINYYPNNEKRDNTFRAIRVEVKTKDNRKLIARTRMGYFARDNQEPAP